MRDEFKHLLVDDNDMVEMYLTEKLKLEYSSVSSMNEQDEEISLDICI